MKIRYIVKLYCPKDSKESFYEYKTELEERAAMEQAENYLKNNGKIVSDCKIELSKTSPEGRQIVNLDI